MERRGRGRRSEGLVQQNAGQSDLMRYVWVASQLVRARLLRRGCVVRPLRLRGVASLDSTGAALRHQFITLDLQRCRALPALAGRPTASALGGEVRGCKFATGAQRLMDHPHRRGRYLRGTWAYSDRRQRPCEGPISRIMDFIQGDRISTAKRNHA